MDENIDGPTQNEGQAPLGTLLGGELAAKSLSTSLSHSHSHSTHAASFPPRADTFASAATNSGGGAPGIDALSADAAGVCDAVIAFSSRLVMESRQVSANKNDHAEREHQLLRDRAALEAQRAALESAALASAEAARESAVEAQTARAEAAEARTQALAAEHLASSLSSLKAEAEETATLAREEANAASIRATTAETLCAETQKTVAGLRESLGVAEAGRVAAEEGRAAAEAAASASSVAFEQRLAEAAANMEAIMRDLAAAKEEVAGLQKEKSRLSSHARGLERKVEHHEKEQKESRSRMEQAARALFGDAGRLLQGGAPSASQQSDAPLTASLLMAAAAAAGGGDGGGGGREGRGGSASSSSSSSFSSSAAATSSPSSTLGKQKARTKDTTSAPPLGVAQENDDADADGDAFAAAGSGKEDEVEIEEREEREPRASSFSPREGTLGPAAEGSPSKPGVLLSSQSPRSGRVAFVVEKEGAGYEVLAAAAAMEEEGEEVHEEEGAVAAAPAEADEEEHIMPSPAAAAASSARVYESRAESYQAPQEEGEEEREEPLEEEDGEVAVSVEREGQQQESVASLSGVAPQKSLHPSLPSAALAGNSQSSPSRAARGAVPAPAHPTSSPLNVGAKRDRVHLDDDDEPFADVDNSPVGSGSRVKFERRASQSRERAKSASQRRREEEGSEGRERESEKRVLPPPSPGAAIEAAHRRAPSISATDAGASTVIIAGGSSPATSVSKGLGSGGGSGPRGTSVGREGGAGGAGGASAASAFQSIEDELRSLRVFQTPEERPSSVRAAPAYLLRVDPSWPPDFDLKGAELPPSSFTVPLGEGRNVLGRGGDTGMADARVSRKAAEIVHVTDHHGGGSGSSSLVQATTRSYLLNLGMNPIWVLRAGRPGELPRRVLSAASSAAAAAAAAAAAGGAPASSTANKGGLVPSALNHGDSVVFRMDLGEVAGGGASGGSGGNANEQGTRFVAHLDYSFVFRDAVAATASREPWTAGTALKELGK